MKFFRASDHVPESVDRNTFSGDATMARMDRLNEDPQINVYRVTFEAGARTAWHTHIGGPQLLLITEGTCRVQKAGEAVREIGSGGAVRIEPGERHWHGASPKARMTHLAVNVDTTTEWHEKVADEDFYSYCNQSD